MTTISLKIRQLVQTAVHKLALAIVQRSSAMMAWSTITTKIPSTPLPESTASAEPATAPASSDGVQKAAAGDGEEKPSTEAITEPLPKPENVTEPVRRFALLRKGHIYAGYFLTLTETHNAVIKVDPRCMPQFACWSYLTPSEAEKYFNEVLAISRDRGFTVEFNGRPNNAQYS